VASMQTKFLELPDRLTFIQALAMHVASTATSPGRHTTGSASDPVTGKKRRDFEEGQGP
jgi:hypothetical protein